VSRPHLLGPGKRLVPKEAGRPVVWVATRPWWSLTGRALPAEGFCGILALRASPMRTPHGGWTEEYVLSLPLGEDDSFERKGTRPLDLALPDVRQDSVLNLDELAKQLSAFANTGGGALIYVVDDRGRVDHGGVSRVIKGRKSTKDWLESFIPSATEFEIVGVNVREIVAQQAASSIQPDKALFVVEIPDSERAPHQSVRDKRYYVRLGGRSQPASHRLIEDIRNRSTHPNVELSAVEILNLSAQRQVLFDQQQLRHGGEVRFSFRIRLRNQGSLKASNVAFLFSPSLGVGLAQARLPNARLRVGPQSALVWELDCPMFPQMEMEFDITCLARVELRNARLFVQGTGTSLDKCKVPWKVFADSAVPKSGEIDLGSLGLLQRAYSEWMSAPPDR